MRQTQRRNKWYCHGEASFYTKVTRDTIAERARLEERNYALRLANRSRGEKEEEEIQKNLRLRPNISYDMNEAAEYESWKTREIARITRERDDRDASVKERKRREEEEGGNGAEKPKATSATEAEVRFMQKYITRVSFFQSSSDDHASDKRQALMDVSGRTNGLICHWDQLTGILREYTFNPRKSAIVEYEWPLRSSRTAKCNGRYAAPIETTKRSKKLKDWRLKKINALIDREWQIRIPDDFIKQDSFKPRIIGFAQSASHKFSPIRSEKQITPLPSISKRN
ncbi:hypothetical protein C4D60_Mb00t19560 [Musa balbisiana]|uniref:Micro-fibrillar-associated protein 1 C-terminal domain-containing protein n=1 Tax=Musa balbisiana TaxID=52838 RepID=A0A4S8I330_MUSBA|nr:hypothetical protein C4D60_Mb00t19560 [Musa balbisiana]